MAGCCVLVKFAARESIQLSNSYKNILRLAITVPARGSVVLTGSGLAKVMSVAGTPWAWLNISIGPVSLGGGANNGNETGVEWPGVPAGNVTIGTPFSLTSVFPVGAGTHRFYMVGAKDPNANTWYVNFAKLTAMYVRA